MTILVKYPTRSRPQRFLKTLSEWITSATDLSKISWLISYDADDQTMTEPIIKAAYNLSPNLIAVKGASKTKIEACNSDIEKVPVWGVVLLISDDTWCRRAGWDQMIRDNMLKYYPNTDGCLWFHDGTKQREICTISCIGRRYYDRFGYIYHPSFSSFFCDNEFTEIAQRDGKIVFIDQPLATHEHPAWGRGMKQDALYTRNDRFWQQDKVNYEKRKAEGFPK